MTGTTREPHEGAEPQDPPRATTPPARVWLRPTPEVRRVGKTAVLLVLVLVLAGMTLLSFRYSRQAAPRAGGDGGSMSLSEPPLAPSQIERFEPRAPVHPPEPNPLLAKLLAAQREKNRAAQAGHPAVSPPPRAHQSAGPSVRLIQAPLEVRRPSGRAGSGDGAGSEPPRDLLGLGLGEVALPSAPPAARQEPAHPDPRVLAVAAGDPLAAPISPAPRQPVVREGTILPAVLGRALRSDLAGPVHAVITRDVYDSVSLATLLIPRGTVALGRQSRQPLFGESRLVILWHRLLLPDGRSIALEEAPATGQDGALGLPGQVNHHWGKRFAAVGLLSLAGAGVQLSQPQRGASGLEAPDPGQLAAGELGLQIGRLSQEILRQAIQVPPTVSLTAGSRLGILVTRDLLFPRTSPREAGS